MSKPDYAYVTIIAAPPEEVWRGLTTAEFTRQYWHTTSIRSDFEEGSPVEFRNIRIKELPSTGATPEQTATLAEAEE